jgi:ABC-type amino acid transport substrate-binding protein
MKFYPMVALQKALSDLENGSVDLIVAQFPVTKENRSKLLFTDEVYIDRQVLVQRKTSDGAVSVRNQLDLAGKTVWIVKGSPMKERIINLGDEIGDSINVEEDALYGPEQLFLQVATGEIEYAVINGRIAKFMAPKYGNVDVSTSISFSQIQAWAMHINNTELQTQINGWLKSMKETDDYKSLYNRYFEEEK